MKRVICLVSLIGIIIMASACRDDILIDPPESLEGRYIGFFVTKEGTTTEQIQAITWRFEANGYSMRYDDERGETRRFCDSDGKFEFDGKAVVLEVIDPNPNVSVCNPSLNPEGEYERFLPEIIEGQDSSEIDDTVRFIQIEGATTRTLKLVREEISL